MKRANLLKIILIRHGRPIANSNRKVGAAGFAMWIRAYNHSFVDSESSPPEDLRNACAHCYTVSSSMNRARHSAEPCLGKAPDLILDELQEMDIPRLKLPISMTAKSWLTLSRLCWLLLIAGKSESYKAGKIRVQTSVDILTSCALANTNIAVFGHGFTNYLIAKELKRRGWTITRQAKRFWGTIELICNHTG